MVDNNLQESPEQKTTRNSLGSGAIVSVIGSLNAPVINDVDATYCSIDLVSTDVAEENVVQCPMPFNGRFKKIKLFVVTISGITANVTLTLRKNGIDTSDVITLKPTDSGILDFDLSTEFLESDLMSWRQNGNNAGGAFDLTPQIILEYDA